MPELPEVEAVRRQLDPVMSGARFDRVTVRRPDLRRPFPARFAARLRGTTVRDLTRRGKYLLADLSSEETLLLHLGMSGWIRVGGSRADADAHDHVVFRMSSGAVVTFNDPRRFGLMDLVASAKLHEHPSLGALGPEPLSRDFTGVALARACARKRVSLKVALLDQRVVAGLGNIYASEALHLAGLSPAQPAGSLATVSGLPRPSAHRLAEAIKRVLRRAISRQVSEAYRDSRFRVYDREGEPCPTRRCRGTIVRFDQAGRSTFFCPVCQRVRRRALSKDR
jgi:formamidopyrimidine-DNA glycosylase